MRKDHKMVRFWTVSPPDMYYIAKHSGYSTVKTVLQLLDYGTVNKMNLYKLL